MSYIYEEYAVSEKLKSYVVTSQVSGEETIKIRVDKEVIDKINSDEDPEMLAILCATVEFARFDAKACNKSADKTIITSDEFRENLQLLLAIQSIEDVIAEISDMKYFEIKEYFN